jgi:hypothetical protein
MGDSHAGHLTEAIKVWYATRNGSVDPITLMQTACVPLRGATPVIGGYKQLDCRRANEAHYATIVAASEERNKDGTPLDVGVVLAARWTMYQGQKNISIYEPWVGQIDSSASSLNDERAFLEAKLRSDITYLTSKSIRVLFVLSPPELKFPLGKCLERIAAYKCATSKSEYLRHQAVIRDIAAVLSREFPNSLQIFDPIEVFCPKEICEVILDDHQAYSDTSHLSGYGALAIVPNLTPLLNWVSGHGQMHAER